MPQLQVGDSVQKADLRGPVSSMAVLAVLATASRSLVVGGLWEDRGLELEQALAGGEGQLQ